MTVFKIFSPGLQPLGTKPRSRKFNQVIGQAMVLEKDLAFQ